MNRVRFSKTQVLKKIMDCGGDLDDRVNAFLQENPDYHIMTITTGKYGPEAWLVVEDVDKPAAKLQEHRERAVKEINVHMTLDQAVAALKRLEDEAWLWVCAGYVLEKRFGPSSKDEGEWRARWKAKWLAEPSE